MNATHGSESEQTGSSEFEDASPSGPEDPFDALPKVLADAITDHGYDSLTSVQEAVLDPALRGHDLRLSSQTGSGKTVAIGIVLGWSILDATESHRLAPGALAAPLALVVAPTRELAAQVQLELSWLYAGARYSVVAVTGGTSVTKERGDLRARPQIIVATPGRLIDHLERGAIDPSNVRAIVMDEADRMLDLGFREPLEEILGRLPKERRTHLVSATFSREVIALADGYQRDAKSVEGTELGSANSDITHVIHVVPDNRRLDAIVNVLLSDPSEHTLVFVRTRADTAELARLLDELGFSVGSLSGDMEQAARTRTLNSFREGRLGVLVATDVAARGIDVQDIARVIHADPPGDADTYTHRSGRTGRAGKKGESVLLIPAHARNRARFLLRRAQVFAEERPVPTPEQVRRAADDRLLERLASAKEAFDPRRRETAKRLLETLNPIDVVTQLLAMGKNGLPCEPREVPLPPLPDRPLRESRTMPPLARPTRGADRRDSRPEGRHESRPRVEPPRMERAPERVERDSRDVPPAPRADVKPRRRAESAEPSESRAAADVAREPSSTPAVRPPRAKVRDAGADVSAHGSTRDEAPRQAEPRAESGDFVPFHVSWGSGRGADARRLLALVCRRGNIRGGDVGAITIHEQSSIVEVRASVADTFGKASQETDPRDPGVKFRPYRPATARSMKIVTEVQPPTHTKRHSGQDVGGTAPPRVRREVKSRSKT